MNTYIAAEKELAALLGWTGIQLGGMDGEVKIPDSWLTGIKPGRPNTRDLIPPWARQSGPALELMTEHDICIAFEQGLQLGSPTVLAGVHVEQVFNHADKNAAARYAIVRAVIAKLKATR